MRRATEAARRDRLSCRHARERSASRRGADRARRWRHLSWPGAQGHVWRWLSMACSSQLAAEDAAAKPTSGSVPPPVSFRTACACMRTPWPMTPRMPWALSTAPMMPELKVPWPTASNAACRVLVRAALFDQAARGRDDGAAWLVWSGPLCPCQIRPRPAGLGPVASLLAGSVSHRKQGGSPGCRYAGSVSQPPLPVMMFGEARSGWPMSTPVGRARWWCNRWGRCI